MAWGRRCDLGCESWPDKAIYSKCPRCGMPAERFSNLKPLSDEEATSILAHIQFEEYYERRCAQRGIPTEGPLKDDSCASG